MSVYCLVLICKSISQFLVEYPERDITVVSEPRILPSCGNIQVGQEIGKSERLQWGVLSIVLKSESCPVKDVHSFEQIVNTNKLIDACRSVDPLIECGRPICEPAIVGAAVHLASRDWSSLAKNKKSCISIPKRENYIE